MILMINEIIISYNVFVAPKNIEYLVANESHVVYLFAHSLHTLSYHIFVLSINKG